jgi:Ni,Fe-hydrogenase maturation factor
MRTFIGGIASAEALDNGGLVREQLHGDASLVAAHVVVEDLANDPLEVAARLGDEWPHFERVIFVGTVARSRPPGTLVAYRWNGESAGSEVVDGRGTLDDTLRAVRDIVELPDDIIVVEVEPESDTGEAETDRTVRATLRASQALLRRLATNRAAAAELPAAALGDR